MRGGLQQQRRFADARLAADQHERSGHDAAAEHAIELADAGRQPLGDDGVDVGVELRPGRRRQRVALLRRWRRRRGHRPLLDERVPRAALGQRPSHFGACAPQAGKMVLGFIAPSSVLTAWFAE